MPLPDRFGSGAELPPVSRQEIVETLGTKVLVAKPWQKSVHPLTAFSVGQLCDHRRTGDLLKFGDAFVAHTRNKCAEAFLNSPCEWMLTVDDDMIVPFGNAKWFRMATGFNFPQPFSDFNAIDRLMSHKKTLVGALYSGRYPGSNLMYGEAANPEESAWARRGPYNQIKPTRWVATGCLLIHRSVFEDIEKRFPRLARGGDKKGGQWFASTEASLIERIQSIRDRLLDGGALTAEKAFKALEGLESALAEARTENPLGSGEDVSFCLRASAAGHQPYVDMGLVCGHIGHCVYGLHNTGLK